MNRTLCMLLLLSTNSQKITATSRIENQLKKIGSFFNYSHEKTEYKELPVADLTSLTIENYYGPISIKTGWKKDYLCLKTIKKSRKQKDLDLITVATTKTKANSLHISTHCSHVRNNGSVEYELIVPTSLAVNLKTDSGDIYINNIQGAVHTHTRNGTTTIINTKNNIHATSTNGDITIQETSGAVHASSSYGNITIQEACNSITSQSIKGKIDIHYKILPAYGTVKLETTSGNITLALPTHTNATIHGVTTHATLSSDHYIILNPCKTQLNDYAWNKFKREVHGLMGSGDAKISLHSVKGTIKILDSHQ